MKNNKVLLITLIMFFILALGVLYYVYDHYEKLEKEEVKPTLKTDKINTAFDNTDYNNLYYDVIVNECKNYTSSANDFTCILLNTIESVKYNIVYNIGNKVIKNATIYIEDINDNEMKKLIKNKDKLDVKAKVKSLIDSNINDKYNLNIVYQNIDDIKYDIFIKKEKGKKNDEEKSYYYELVNQKERLKYKVTINDYEDSNKRDKVIVKIYKLKDDELSDILKEYAVFSEAKALKDLTSNINNYKVEKTYE